VRNVESLRVIDLEVDADVCVDGPAGARPIARALLQGAGTTKLLDLVRAVFVELGF